MTVDEAPIDEYSIFDVIAELFSGRCLRISSGPHMHNIETAATGTAIVPTMNREDTHSRIGRSSSSAQITTARFAATPTAIVP